MSPARVALRAPTKPTLNHTPQRQVAKKAAAGGVRVGPTDLGTIAPYFKGDALVAMLKKPAQLKTTIISLGHWADQDAFSTLNMIKAGEIYHHFLLQPLENQRQFTTAMATELKVEPPVYKSLDSTEKQQGRQETGRNQLAMIIYSKHPDMLQILPGSKDHRAGKRISACLREYRVREGLLQPRQRQLAAGSTIPKTGPKMFMALAAVAEQDEFDILVELAHRAGIGDEFINRWLKAIEGSPQQEGEVEEVTEVAV